MQGGALDYALFTDGNLEKTAKLPIPEKVGQSAWIQYEFEKPETVRAVTFVIKELDPFRAGGSDKVLEASDDSEHFHEIAKLSAANDVSEVLAPEYTLSLPPVTAKYFRFMFKRTPPAPPPAWAVGVDPT